MGSEDEVAGVGLTRKEGDSARRPKESGMVTVETAIALSAVVLVMAALLLALVAGNAQGSLCDAVRAGARAQSLGTDAQQAVAAVTSKPVDLSVVHNGKSFTVTGSRAGLELGGWSFGRLSCQVSGVTEINWAALTNGSGQ